MNSEPAEIIVLGSSASSPFPRTVQNHFSDYLDIANYESRLPLHDDPLCNSAKLGGKDRRTRSSIMLSVGKERIVFDAGPDIEFQLKREGLQKPTAVFITHDHWDASYGLELFRDIPVFQETAGTIEPNQTTLIGEVSVTAFRVIHAANVPCVGYKILCRDKSFAYFTDIGSLDGIHDHISGCDFIFADGSSLEKSYSTHVSMMQQLQSYKAWGVPLVYFTHIGHSNPPHEQLVPLLQTVYPKTTVTFDGMKIQV